MRHAGAVFFYTALVGILVLACATASTHLCHNTMARKPTVEKGALWKHTGCWISVQKSDPRYAEWYLASPSCCRPYHPRRHGEKHGKVAKAQPPQKQQLLEQMRHFTKRNLIFQVSIIRMDFSRLICGFFPTVAMWQLLRLSQAQCTSQRRGIEKKLLLFCATRG